MYDVLRTKEAPAAKQRPTRNGGLWLWVAVPNHSNGRSIYKPVEPAYMHVDSSGYGWGAFRNETTEACGFWYCDCDRELHRRTCKEVKAVRYAVLTFLSELRAAILWFILDSNDISICARYIKTTANIWADRLGREIDCDDDVFVHGDDFQFQFRYYGEREAPALKSPMG
eukprot:jgi/Tetstr1/457103/TSEL_043753.t1